MAGFLLGMSGGWNFGNLGGVASEVAGAYGVGLGGVGLLTTALVITHIAAQVPGGRAADRFGAVSTGIVALVVIAAGNALALAAPEMWLASVARLLVGVGTGLGFISGTALVRQSGGSPLAQGVFGGLALAPSGLALAIVPQLGADDWRTPYWSALALAAIALALVLAVAPRGIARARSATATGHRSRSVLLDRGLYRLAVLYTVSFGFAVVSANWSVELLQRHTDIGHAAAGAVGALMLVLGVLSRPLGGWIVLRRPRLVRRALAASLLAAGLGTVAMGLPLPAWLLVAACGVIGLGAGISFSPAFTGAAQSRRDAPAAAVGAVNGAANVAILAGTPLVGLTFSFSGEGRLGFLAVGAIVLAGLALLPTERELGTA